MGTLLRRLTRRPPAAADHGPPPAGSTAVRADDGVRLHVEVDSPASTAPSDVTVLFVHGFTARLGEFELQRDLLRTAGVRAVLYDHRGHGRSAWGPAENATIEQLASDLSAVLAEAVPPGPVVLLGHSMGGMTVMTLARRQPELFGARSPAGRSPGATCSARTTRTTRCWCGRPRAPLAAMRDLPVTVLCGTHDRLTPLEHSRRIAAELPDAELVVVPGAGHSVNVSRHEVVDDALLRLIERVRDRIRLAG